MRPSGFVMIFAGVATLSPIGAYLLTSHFHPIPVVTELQRRADYIQDPANGCTLAVHKKPKKSWNYVEARIEIDDGRSIWQCADGVIIGMDDADVRKMGMSIMEPK